MCVLPERQVNSAYFTYLIVIQVSVWQHRHFHPSLCFATTAASAGAAALFCSHRPASGPVSAPIPALLARPPCRAPAPRPPTGLLGAGLAPASSSIFPCGGASARASLGTDVPEHWGMTRRSPRLGGRGAPALEGVGELCREPCAPSPPLLLARGRKTLSARSDARGEPGRARQHPRRASALTVRRGSALIV